MEDFIWPPDGEEFTFETLAYRQRKKSNEIVLRPITTDTELVTLNEIPFVNIQPNTLYAPREMQYNPPRVLQYNPDEFALTIIERKQIILAKLLGSGAFGKVFQGTVKDLEGSDTMPVAIKMLQNNASLQEENELLKEAKLMSHFRHKHVLRMLGI
ncbi:proto-oncogene tyrosine-protein kinase ros, partial [Lasius niger]